MFANPIAGNPFLATAAASRPSTVGTNDNHGKASILPSLLAHSGLANSHAVRRTIPPQAGRALEILGHAIEYLTDEYIQEGGSLDPKDARIETVQLLMALNRQVYYDCPQVPAFADRCRSTMQNLMHTLLPHLVTRQRAQHPPLA